MGAGDCADRSVAMLELLLGCARTVWRVDVRARKGGEYAVKDAYLCLTYGLGLQFRAMIESWVFKLYCSSNVNFLADLKVW